MQKVHSLCSVFDEKGDFVTGSKVTNKKPFIETNLNIDHLPGWTTALYIDDSAFVNAASKQTAIYTWTGILVVLLILITAGFTAQAIGKQAKLNRLKNNFIATVSHELKTPLSSMRVLVDTLLEGNYDGQNTATEYLQLVAKENQRLSRLIDNFFTFSRMERNKQAFDMKKVNPAEIAKTAADAVQTKFNKKNCKFIVTIVEDIASISADKDAMVTVLVNLLDNAYKYSYDEKIIELNVFEDQDNVCFTVTDNGKGMTTRVQRKIFERFYQADSTLSRTAEGTGLGLAIVKFIIDAHKGKITVESKPDKGTTFTVTLPKI